MGMTSKAALLFIVLLVPITACTASSATASLPTEILSPTEKPPTVTPTEVSTSPPQKTDTIHLRIEFQTTSDWSDLTFSPKSVLGIKLFSVEGDLFDYAVTPERVSISQPSANAEKGNLVGVTFDIHLDPEALTEPQFILLERGDLNSSMLKIYYVHDDEPILLQEVVHNRMVLDQLGRNPHHFVLDLSPIQVQLDE